MLSSRLVSEFPNSTLDIHAGAHPRSRTKRSRSSEEEHNNERSNMCASEKRRRFASTPDRGCDDDMTAKSDRDHERRFSHYRRCTRDASFSPSLPPHPRSSSASQDPPVLFQRRQVYLSPGFCDSRQNPLPPSSSYHRPPSSLCHRYDGTTSTSSLGEQQRPLPSSPRSESHDYRPSFSPSPHYAQQQQRNCCYSHDRQGPSSHHGPSSFGRRSRRSQRSRPRRDQDRHHRSRRPSPLRRISCHASPHRRKRARSNRGVGADSRNAYHPYSSYSVALSSQNQQYRRRRDSGGYVRRSRCLSPAPGAAASSFWASDDSRYPGHRHKSNGYQPIHRIPQHQKSDSSHSHDNHQYQYQQSRSNRYLRDKSPLPPTNWDRPPHPCFRGKDELRIPVVESCRRGRDEDDSAVRTSGFRSSHRRDAYHREHQTSTSFDRRPRSLTSERSLTLVPPSSKGPKSNKHDDAIVHFQWLPGMKLGRRFVVVSQLGEGTFGRVVECKDLETGHMVAVKVVRDISRYTNAAQIESDILEEIRERDPKNQSNCVQLIERFLYDRFRGRERRSSSLRRHERNPSKRRKTAAALQQRRNSSRWRGQDAVVTSSSSPIMAHRPPRGQHQYSSSDRDSRTEEEDSENHYRPGIHMCLVSEKLGLSLFAFLSQNQYRGFFIEDIQKISFEILKALAFLRRIRLTHTDLKPENILFVNDASYRVPLPRSRYHSRFWDGDADSDTATSEEDDIHHGQLRRQKDFKRSSSRVAAETVYGKPVMTVRPRDCKVKLIDFGSSTFENDSHCSLINTRQYRAPEVILQTGWSTPSDLWCLGCILMEMYTGVLLFRTHEHMEHLALMEKIIGPIPQSVLQAATGTDGSRYLSKVKSSDGLLRLAWPEGASRQKSISKVRRCRPLEAVVLPCHRLFAQFIRYLLQLDPSRRPTPTEAMQHPFFEATLPEA